MASPEIIIFEMSPTVEVTTSSGAAMSVAAPPATVIETTEMRVEVQEKSRVVAIDINVVDGETNPTALIYGTVATVVPGATSVVVSFVAPSGYKLAGFMATGNGDGYFILTLDGVTKLTGRISAINKTYSASISPLPITPGGIVVLSVQNEAEVSCSYEGTLIGG